MSTRVNSYWALLAVSAVVVSIRIGSAAPSQNNAPSRLTFAAASVRSGGLDGGSPLKCKGRDGELVGSGMMIPETPVPQGRCTAGNASLLDLVAMAYSSSLAVTVVGLPSGLPKSYQVQAVAENPSQATKGELRQMLRALLEDRFKAKVRIETKQADGYVLTIARGGIKFKANPDAQELLPVLGPVSLEPPIVRDGVMRGLVQGNFKMARFAYFLEDSLGIPIIDKTNLPGIYDMTLKISAIFPRDSDGTRAGPGAQVRIQYDPPLPRALEEQLGLHLERSEIQVETLIVDRLEKPTDN